MSKVQLHAGVGGRALYTLEGEAKNPSIEFASPDANARTMQAPSYPCPLLRSA